MYSYLLLIHLEVTCLVMVQSSTAPFSELKRTMGINCCFMFIQKQPAKPCQTFTGTESYHVLQVPRLVL